MAAVKTIGRSGQIALGKEHAGKQVLVDQVEPGVWMIKLGEFVPDSERWLFQDNIAAELDEAIGWAENNPPSETDVDTLDGTVSDR
jgi:hypothetical protein